MLSNLVDLNSFEYASNKILYGEIEAYTII